ncbi:MAG: cbb3-type cytochrome c oxidase subunit 3 [Phycisphaerales bacterium]|nr:MAG: cbb3-type cytochrome c oxidase subunit 3 [Phycisphaerales bacterium]
MLASEGIIFGIDGGLLKSIALVMCFAIFVSIVLWLAVSSSTKFQRAARLPLEDEVVSEAADASGDRGDHQSGSSRHD